MPRPTRPCKIYIEYQRLTNTKEITVQFPFLHSTYQVLLIRPPKSPQIKNPLISFLFSVQFRTFVPSYQSRAKKRKEPRTITNSLPVTELPLHYSLITSYLQQTYYLFPKNVGKA